jgi:hypothetical protein
VLREILFVAAVVFGLVACAGGQGSENKFHADRLGLGEDGSTVSLDGYLQYGSHARQLWSSKSAQKRGDFSQCVTLIGTARLHNRIIEMSGQIVHVEGKMRRDVLEGYVDFGACNKVGVEVTDIRLARPGR